MMIAWDSCYSHGLGAPGDAIILLGRPGSNCLALGSTVFRITMAPYFFFDTGYLAGIIVLLMISNDLGAFLCKGLPNEQ